MLTPYIWYQFETISTTQVKNYGSGGTALDATLHNGASVMKSDSPVGSVCLNLMNTPINNQMMLWTIFIISII